MPQLGLLSTFFRGGVRMLLCSMTVSKSIKTPFGGKEVDNDGRKTDLQTA